MKKQKIMAGSYWVLDENRERIARIDQTGVVGRDDYPWEWVLVDEVRFGGEKFIRAGGTGSTMTECMDVLQGRIKAYGLVWKEMKND